MINTSEKLSALAHRLKMASWVAVDTEADSLHAYPEKLCLIQIGLPSEDLVVDPLADLDLGPLWAALDGRELIFHGADYDLRLLHRQAGFAPERVFDTMIAARLLGRTEFGLTDLVADFLGVELEKGAQKANWAIRPLTDKMLAYARNDTHYLKPLADLLRAELERQHRLEWHQQACAQLIRDCTRPTVQDPDTVWRIKGCDRFDRRTMGLIRELWHWRELEAREVNRPPFFVLSHDTLLALATAASKGHAFRQLIPRRYSPRRQAGLVRAIEHAMSLPEAKLPDRRRHQGYRLTQADKQRLENLRQRRDRKASELGLDPALIASRATLTLLARSWEEHRDALLPWQRELLAQ